MSPPRRPPQPSDGPDRAALEALRAQMEARRQTPPGGRRRERTARPARSGRQGRNQDWGEAWDEGADAAADVAADVGATMDEQAGWPPPLDEDGSGSGRRWWDDHPGRPIPVEDGIAAATRRGPIGASWWSRRFLDSLEAVLVGGRMERGRSYARKGQVVSLALGAGAVTAVVQGSRAEPYRVRLVMPVVTDEEWQRIVVALAAQARYAARLLAGELPHEVEDVFAETGASLFPGPQARLVTECTCPDFENPCKHIAAVCYLVAEMFDADPFRVLEWRGRGRAAVVEALRQHRKAAGPEAGSGTAVPSPALGTVPGRDDGDVAVDPGSGSGAEGPDGGSTGDGFWAAGTGLSEVHVRPSPAPLPDAVLRQLPRGLILVDGRDVSDVLSPAYELFTAAAARRAGR